MSDLENINTELPEKINRILDSAIDSQFMKRGFKASAMREAILNSLKENDLFIVQAVDAKIKLF